MENRENCVPICNGPCPREASRFAVKRIAVIGSVFAATLLKVRSRDVLLPVLLYPLLVPLFVAGTKTTAALLAALPTFDAAWFWIEFPRSYAAALLVRSIWVFATLRRG